jgi:Tol biopolymer transport system component
MFISIRKPGCFAPPAHATSDFSGCDQQARCCARACALATPDPLDEAMKILLVGALLLTFSAADIFRMEADGLKVVQLTRNDIADSTPVFTPDGRPIVWASELDGNLDVFRMRAGGSEPVNLSRHPGADGHPRVSPGGQLIYFNSNRSSGRATFSRGTKDRDHNHEIYTMALDGGKSESGRNSEVFWMDLRTGGQKNLTANQAHDGWPG